MNLSRRRLLTAAPAAAALTALSGTHARAALRPRRRKAMNVIFMVSDGMSMGTLTLANICHEHRHSKPSTWVELLSTPGVRRASAFTYSADSLVTDSAAGSSAWGIGERVNNKSISVTPDGRNPEPLLVQARRQGKATGLVTSTTVTHATPAGFIANCPDRALEPQIAVQMMDRGFDVVLGGGRMFFPPSTLARMKHTLVTNTAELRASADKPGPLLGLFAPSHVAYDIERPAEQPELAEMTKAALDRLFKSPNGFVLQVEGGRVDHAAHTNDAAALVHDQLAFDRALRVVWEATKDRDDTLVIVTTDHGNANPALTVSNAKTWTGVYLLNSATHSFDWIIANAQPKPATLDETAYESGGDLREAKHADRVAELVKQALSIELDKAERATLAAAMAGKPVDPFEHRCSATSVLGSLLANHTTVAFLSANHTSDMVEVTSWGPGSEAIKPVINNFDLHNVVTTALELAPQKLL